MIRTGVSGCVFLLVPAYTGSPGPKAVKRLCVCVCLKTNGVQSILVFESMTERLETFETFRNGFHGPCCMFINYIQLHIHTHTPFARTTRVSLQPIRKVKLIWISLKQVTVSGSGIRTSLQTDNHASTPSLSFLQAGCPSCCPTNIAKTLKAKLYSLTDLLFTKTASIIATSIAHRTASVCSRNLAFLAGSQPIKAKCSKIKINTYIVVLHSNNESTTRQMRPGSCK